MEIKVYQEDLNGLWVAEGEAANGVTVIMTGDTREEAIQAVREIIE